MFIYKVSSHGLFLPFFVLSDALDSIKVKVFDALNNKKQWPLRVRSVVYCCVNNTDVT